jgi:hypothetical protein
MPPLAPWLDLAWLAISLCCLILQSLCNNRKQQCKGRGLRSTAVFAILVVLFPYLSATDDLIGLALLAPPDHSRTEAASPVPFDTLAGARMELGIRLQKLANFHATPIHPEPDVLRALALLPVSSSDLPWRPAPRQASRAPPSAAIPG